MPTDPGFALPAGVTRPAACVLALGLVGALLAGLGGLASAGRNDAPTADLDLAVTLSGPAAVAPGGSLRYIVAVTNTSAADAPDVVVTGTLPAPLDLADLPEGAAVVGPRMVRWDLGMLAAGGGRRLDLMGHVPVTAALGAKVLGEVRAQSALTETVTENNAASLETTFRATDLQVEIGTAAADVRPGELMTHTLTFFNVSLPAAEGIVVTATLAPGTQWVRDNALDPAGGFTRTLVAGGSGGGGGPAGQTVRWERAEAPGVWTGYIDLVTRVGREVPAGTELVHRVTVSSATLDGLPANNTASSAPLAVVVPDLWLSLKGPALAAPGDNVEYTLTYGNRGSGASPRPRITGALPAGLVYVSALPPATVQDERTLTWELGRVPPGAESMISVRARVAAAQTAGTELVNRAVIAAIEPDLRPADNAASATTTIVPGPPTAVELVVPAEVPAGDGAVAVTAEVRDAAGNPAIDGTVVLLDATHGQLAASMPTTQGGRVATEWRPGRQAAPAAITARAGGVTVRREVAIVPGPPARLRVLPAPAAPKVGQPVELALSVWDAFDNPVRNGTPLQITPAQGTIEPASVATAAGRATATWRNTRAGRFLLSVTAGELTEPLLLTWKPEAPAAVHLALERAEIPVDDGRTMVWASVDDRYGNPVADGASVAFGGGGGRFTPQAAGTIGGLAETSFVAGAEPGRFTLIATSAGLEGRTPVRLVPADLALSSQLTGPRGLVPGSQIQPGDRVTYTLAVRNDGTATARNVLIGAALEERVRLASLSADRPVAPAQNVKPGLFTGPSAHYVRHAWSLPDLPPRDALTLTLVAAVDRHADPLWTGFDTVFFRSAITTTTAEASPADLVRTEKSDIQAADLFVQGTLDSLNSSIRPGGQLIYDVSLGNAQAAEVPRATITATLPTWVSFDHWQPDQTEGLREIGTFGAESRELVWAFDGPWRQNQGLRLWLDIAPEAPPETVLEQVIEIGSPVYDVDPDNNVSVSSGARLKGANLRAGAGGPAAVAPGETLAWQFSVRNAAPRDSAPDVVVEATLPAGLTVARTDPAPAVQTGSLLRWVLEQSLGPGAEQHFAVDLTVPLDAPVGTEYRGAVEVSSSQRDAFTDDNRATLVTRVVPGAPATLTLEAGAERLTACSEETVQITATLADRSGNPVADGTPLRWQATAGTLSEAETSTAGGRAVVRLAAARTVGTATVRAEVGALGQAVEIAMPVGPPGRLVVTANPGAVAWDGATEVTVAVTDACGNPVADRWPIQLAAERGEWPGGGLTLALPTDAGRVAATLQVGQTAGAMRITASDGAAGGTASGETVVTVGPKPPRPSRWTAFLPWANQRVLRLRR